MFHIGDIVEVVNDTPYSYTKRGSYGEVVSVTETACRVRFIKVYNQYGRPLRVPYVDVLFIIQIKHLQLHDSTEPQISPVIRKIRQMEQHFLNRKETSNV